MSKVTYKFQLTLPKRVREKFEFKEGDTLVFVEEDDKLILMKSTEYWFDPDVCESRPPRPEYNLTEKGKEDSENHLIISYRHGI